MSSRDWSRRELIKLGVLAPVAAASGSWAQSTGRENLALNRAAWTSTCLDFNNTGHMATDGRENTRWRSGPDEKQWIYVDLGAFTTVDGVALGWQKGYATAYTLQVSPDRDPSRETGYVERWTDVYRTVEGKGCNETVAFKAVETRYVRLLCTARTKMDRYELATFEVYGKSLPKPALEVAPVLDAHGVMRLESGWRLIHQDYIREDVADVSEASYDASHWLRATVPGTVLTSYLNAGAVPDPFYSDHQLQVSDFFAHSKWMYRTEVLVPAEFRGRRAWLKFDGISYRAYVYVGGHYVGRIDGAFVRGAFDISEFVTPGTKTRVVVLIMPTPSPDVVSFKGLTAAHGPKEYPKAEPVILPAASWDWLPTIRDRDIGIWNRVALTSSGDVTIGNPFASIHFPKREDLSRADVTLKLELVNHAARAVSGSLVVRLGSISLERVVALHAQQTLALSLTPQEYAQLALHHPKLWWPNGYGEQNLYDLTIGFYADGAISDVHRSRIGIREYSYNHEPLTEWDLKAIENSGPLETRVRDPLTIRCNGVPIFMRGVNWGIDEGMLRCEHKGFETRLRMERGMNFNIIRNWAGNVDKEDFFDLCDEYGLMVWEDFGLSNEFTPDNPGMWLDNARDRFLHRRNRTCVVVWCSANEAMPKDPILTAMPAMAKELDGTRLFLHSSVQVPPTNADGPYQTRPPSFYFKDLAGGFRTELGSAVVPCVESMRRMMPGNRLWPINELWGVHDWLLSGWGGMGLCGPTQTAIDCYGKQTGIEDFCRKAQMVNMEVFKAIFEAWNDRMWDDCTGVMLWMSNPAWPSLTWNTYDYYKEPTATYFAARKACEPVHVQWNIATGAVKVCNTSLHNLAGWKTTATIYQFDGRIALTKSVKVDVPANSTRECMRIFSAGEAVPEGLSEIHFIHLVLEDGKGMMVSDNFYWRAKTEWRYEGLVSLMQVKLVASMGAVERRKVNVRLRNLSDGVALMARVKVVDLETEQLVAPLLYSDNYVSLVPGGSKQIEIELPEAVDKSRPAAVWIEGWNVIPVEIGRIVV